MDEAPNIPNPLLGPQVKDESDKDARIAELQRKIQAEKELRVKNEAEVIVLKEKIEKVKEAIAKFKRREEVAPLNPPPPSDMASSDLSYQFPLCPATTNVASRKVSSATVSKAGASVDAAREKFRMIEEVSVVGETLDEKAVLDFRPPHMPKVPKTQKFLEDAIKKNPILGLLEQCQIRDIVYAMERRLYRVGEVVIKEGEEGEDLFVSEHGNFQVAIGGRHVRMFGPGVVFGELALLYERPRAASVTVGTGVSSKHVARIWVIDRQTFQMIMMQTGLLRERLCLKSIRECEVFKHLHGDAERMMQLVNGLTEERYNPGEYVCKEGAIGSTFYIVQEGQLDVITRHPQDGCTAAPDGGYIVKSLKAGDTFGERAILVAKIRTASVRAVEESVLLSMDQCTYLRAMYQKPLPLSETMPGERLAAIAESEDTSEVKFNDLSRTAFSTLGFLQRRPDGGWSKVELAQLGTRRCDIFALKCIRKEKVLSQHKQASVFSEKDILKPLRNHFIARLHATFHDSRYLYMVLEPCLGGDLRNVISAEGRLGNTTACFNLACVIEALDYLHSNHIIFRNLQPSNVVRDRNGFCKLIDFGCAKRLLPPATRTWTFCGPPSFMAPEIITHKGHSFSVDLWSLGVLLYEMISGLSPFGEQDPRNTAKVFVKVLSGLIKTKAFSLKEAFPRNAKNLILQLCVEEPNDRLGARRSDGGLNAICKHAFFASMDWRSLRQRTLHCPARPDRRVLEDERYFPGFEVPFNYDAGNPLPETSGWAEGF